MLPMVTVKISRKMDGCMLMALRFRILKCFQQFSATKKAFTTEKTQNERWAGSLNSHLMSSPSRHGIASAAEWHIERKSRHRQYVVINSLAITYFCNIASERQTKRREIKHGACSIAFGRRSVED